MVFIWVLKRIVDLWIEIYEFENIPSLIGNQDIQISDFYFWIAPVRLKITYLNAQKLNNGMLVDSFYKILVG